MLVGLLVGASACAEDTEQPGFTSVSTQAEVGPGPGSDPTASDEVTSSAVDPDDDGEERLDVAVNHSQGENGGDGGPTTDCEQVLYGILRDFSSTHPDFEGTNVGIDLGIVQPTLGADNKPVYAGGTASTTTGQANFDQWFRPVAGVNMELPIGIQLTEDPANPGQYVYDNRHFFPADNAGLGNEGREHNFHFTIELHTKFEYKGGEVFTFRGDDDLFTFVNGKLAIDIGGVHLPLERTIDMDARAAELGLEVGKEYTLDFFFVERHTLLSNFRIETSIECFVYVPQG